MTDQTARSELRLRPYRLGDGEKIVAWCADEKAFYKWSAGILGEYPLTPERFNQAMAARDTSAGYFPFVVEDDTGVVGFFILRQPGDDPQELRFGFVIVDSKIRGKGYGKKMLQLGIRYAFRLYGAKKVGLGVFVNNPGALGCYRAVGFRETGACKEYSIAGETWTCLELEMRAEDDEN